MARLKTTNDDGKKILQQIRKTKPFLQGSLSITKKRCGNPNCRCAKEGPVHETALLTWKENKITKTMHIPISLRKEVKKWVEEGKRLKELIQQMSKTQREFLCSIRKSSKD